jgi:hypothetical protein
MRVDKVPFMPAMVESATRAIREDPRGINGWEKLADKRFEPGPNDTLVIVPKGNATVQAARAQVPVTPETKSSLARAVKHEVFRHYGPVLGPLLITENQLGAHPISETEWVGPNEIMDIDQKAKAKITPRTSHSLAQTTNEKSALFGSMDSRYADLTSDGAKEVREALHKEITVKHSEEFVSGNLDEGKIKNILGAVLDDKVKEPREVAHRVQMRAQWSLNTRAPPQHFVRDRLREEPLQQPQQQPPQAAQGQPPQPAQGQPPQPAQGQPPQPAAAPWAVAHPQVQPAAAPLVGAYRTAPQVPPPGDPPAGSGG